MNLGEYKMKFSLNYVKNYFLNEPLLYLELEVVTECVQNINILFSSNNLQNAISNM